MNRIDVAVVGGGISGLMCAVLLARQGASVCILERASRAGGRALSPSLRGVALNLGAHALYLGGPGERVLGELGVTFEGVKPSASDAWLAEAGGVFASPTTLLSLLGSGHFSLGERIDLMRFFATLDRVAPASVSGLSTIAWLDSLRLRPRARRFIDTMVRVSTYSNAPDITPASIALRQLQIAIGRRAKGVVYVEDGWQALVARLEEAASAAGVRTMTHAHVTRVERGRVELEGGEAIDAAHVVVALPREAAAHIVPEMDPRRLPMARAACFDMVIDEAPARRLVFGLDEPHYFSVHSPKTAHALRYLAPHERGSDCKAALEAWLGRVVPDLDKHVVARRFLPEMEVASAFARSQQPPTLERTHFAGDWTSMKHILLDAVAESAETVARQVLEERTRTAA